MELSEKKINNLNSAISDLENSSAAIKGYSKIFQELSELQSLLNEDRKALKSTSQLLENVSNSIDLEFTEYKDVTIKLITDASVEIGEKLEELLKKPTNEINQASSKLQSVSSAIDEEFTEYKDITIKLITDASVEIGEKLEELLKKPTNEINQASSKLQSVSSAIDEQISQIKSLLREIDSSLVTRLDKHKSDIIVDIRNEGTQIQRALETSVYATINNLRAVLLEEYKAQKKTIKFQTTVIVMLAILTVASVAATYIFIL